MVPAERERRLGNLSDHRKWVYSHHEFWPDSISLLDAAGFELAGTMPNQLTDLYLLGLAVRNSGRLVTFDGHIPWRAVAGCMPENVDVLGSNAAG